MDVIANERVLRVKQSPKVPFFPVKWEIASPTVLPSRTGVLAARAPSTRGTRTVTVGVRKSAARNDMQCYTDNVYYRELLNLIRLEKE